MHTSNQTEEIIAKVRASRPDLDPVAISKAVVKLVKLAKTLKKRAAYKGVDLKETKKTNDFYSHADAMARELQATLTTEGSYSEVKFFLVLPGVDELRLI